MMTEAYALNCIEFHDKVIKTQRFSIVPIYGDKKIITWVLKKKLCIIFHEIVQENDFQVWARLFFSFVNILYTQNFVAQLV